MTHTQLLRLTFMFLAALVTVPAVAAPKDAATLQKIDEAMNVHYIAAHFDKAESVLLAAIKSCGAKACSGEVLANAYIYVGIIRGNSKGDLAGARKAFESAYAADPKMTIDETLVTPAVLAEFNKVIGKEPDSPPPVGEKLAPAPETAAEPVAKREPKQGGLHCSPATGYEVQTARPIPIHCERMEGVVRGELHYKPVEADEFTAILMKFDATNATLRAQVPCDALEHKGLLDVYVIGQDENKDIVDTFGTVTSPIEYTIVDKTKRAPPSYPGESAPKRCADVVSAGAGGAGPGDVCTADVPCQKGHYCGSGICRKTPACEVNADCQSDHCVDGLCAMEQDFEEKSTFNRWMVGLNFAADLWLSTSAKNVCGGVNAANGDYSCYAAGSSRINVSPPTTASNAAVTNRIPMADPNYGGNVKTTLVPSTLRVLGSVDYALLPSLTVGARLGFAFNGGPSTIHYTNGYPSQNKNFLPYHAELRAAYWFTPLDVKGFHPYAGLSAGMAEVDAKVRLTVYADNPTSGRPTIKRSLDAWRKLGQAFAGLNFGGLMNIGSHHNLELKINAMYMLPSAGIVFEPSLGYLFGF